MGAEVIQFHSKIHRESHQNGWSDVEGGTQASGKRDVQNIDAEHSVYLLCTAAVGGTGPLRSPGLSAAWAR